MNRMQKSFVPKSQFRTREAPPLMSKDNKGTPVLLCPFCTPPHPINAQASSMCGTILQVRAIQQVYKVKSSNPNAVCVKCGKGKGEMVLFNGGLVHTYDCKPGVVTLTTPPEYSKLAKRVYGLKAGWLKNFMINRFGVPAPVEEVMPDGKKTGKIFGYFFLKRGKNDNRTNNQGKSTEAVPTEPIS